MQFSKVLINWYLLNRRDLPWRRTADPYRIWLSEIILQQTRVSQGLPYYSSFIIAFPTVFDLARAPQEKVLKLWQGLGYYSRARNLHHTAQYVAEELGGCFPQNYDDLKRLKGIGDYTASAIASFCFNEAVPVVDGNVYRVLARYFNIDTPVNSSAGIKEFKALARELLDEGNPADYNQAIMEFGALQCKPKSPLCSTCPLNDSCLALKNNRIAGLPVKVKKNKAKKRYFNYLVISSEENKTLLEQREGKGIWEGLYQFPLVETTRPLSPKSFLNEEKFRKLTAGARKVTLYNEAPVVHKLSHQHIFTHFWLVNLPELNEQGIPFEKLKQYPVPVLIQNFLEESGMVAW